jgi:GTPase-associated protein 1, N-terminal domain type 2/GTPase-associated protein 1, middle domain
MAWELYYTSSPRGLRVGSRGFCTVARTQGMPLALIDRLESLSGYQPASLQISGNAGAAPPLLAHWRLSTIGRPRSVLSRVAMGGSDYSGRLNKLAYHLVLETSEQAPAGPAWMLSQPDVMKTTWEGEPRLLPPLKLSDAVAIESMSDQPADNRQARALADAFVADASKSACIVYAPGADPLPLLADALSLLEPRLRWQVTFSTCFSELSAGLSCHWRCVPAGCPAAADAHRHATSGVVIELAAQ